jgi:hypothetical protein
MLNNFYGDNVRWFIGLVVDVNDPLKLDRIKVRVWGIHTSDTVAISNDDLPWAAVCIPVTEGGSSGIGANSQIKPRAQVFGLFLDGKDSQLPLILGSIPKIEQIRNNLNSAVETYNNDPTGESGSGASTGIEDDIAPYNESLKAGADGRPGGDLPGGNNNEKAINFFMSIEGGKFTIEQACGIVGNLLKESNNRGVIDPAAINRSEGSQGIAQWNPAKAAGERLQGLQKWAASENLNWRSLYPQLKYIIYELQKYSYLGLSAIRKAKTVRDASIAFEERFERPAKGTTLDRISFASEMYSKYGTGAPQIS